MFNLAVHSLDVIPLC